MEQSPEGIEPAAMSRAERKFSGDDLVHWAWTEPSVWTRVVENTAMLATLQNNSVVTANRQRSRREMA